MTDLMIKKHTFYFGKSDYEGKEGWEAGWDFRILINEDNGEIHIEDTCGRSLPMVWQDIHKLKKAIASVERELISSCLGEWDDQASF